MCQKLTQYPPLSFYKDADFRSPWEAQNLFETNFRCYIWIAKTISFQLIYNFPIKNYEFNEKTKISFEKMCTKKGVSQKWREWTQTTTFVKNDVTPKLFRIFEFCKKHWIRNYSWRLAVKFYQLSLKSDFKKIYIFIF